MASAKNVILIIAIILVFTIFAVYGMNLFLEEPTYSDYCDEGKGFARPIPIGKGGECTVDQELTNRQNQCYQDGNVVINQEYDTEGCLSDFECSNCNNEYKDAREKWSRSYFIVSVIIGIIAIVVGALIFQTDTIGSALMGGGALFTFVSSLRAWSDISDILRFVILGILLAILFYVGVVINKKASASGKDIKH